MSNLSIFLVSLLQEKEPINPPAKDTIVLLICLWIICFFPSKSFDFFEGQRPNPERSLRESLRLLHFPKLWPITLSPVCQDQCAVNNRASQITFFVSQYWRASEIHENSRSQKYRVSQKKVCFKNFGHSGPGPERPRIAQNVGNSGPFGQILDLLGMCAILGLLGHFGPFWAFWAILGHSGPFWAILGLLGHSGPFGPFWAFWAILGHSGHFGPFWVFWAILGLLGHSGNFGPFWAFWVILGHFGLFWAILGILGILGLVGHSCPFRAFWAILELTRPTWKFAPTMNFLRFNQH